MTLPIPDFEQEDDASLANLGRSLKKTVLESKAIATLFCGKRIKRKAVKASLNQDSLTVLQRFGIVTEVGDAFVSAFCAQIIEDKILFSDLPTGKARRDEFFLDPLWEAPTFVYLLVRGDGGNALDVGCGCGVLSIVMSDYCSSVVGVDINPRAVQMSRFNALLNGVKNVTFLTSDLFNTISDQSFDRIIFNSPTGFELKPRSLLEAGEQILERFFRQLPHHLKDGGFAQVNLCVKDYQESSFWNRYINWLGDEHQEFQTLFLELFHVSKGWRFWIGRGMASIKQQTNAFTVTAVTRGWLTVKREKGSSFIVSNNYHQWATQLGSKFGNALFHWLFANQLNKLEQEGFEEQLIKGTSINSILLRIKLHY